MIRVLIIDDEKYIRDELKYFLEKYDDIEISGESGEGSEAIRLVRELEPDVMFLDIQLLDMNGLLVARKIMEGLNPPYIVFVTAYDRYAIQGFEIDAADYILKPFFEDRIKVTVERIRKQLEQENTKSKSTQKKGETELKLNKLCVNKNNRFILIDTNDIRYAVVENNNVYVDTKGGRYLCGYSLKELEDRLPQSIFIRIHKSYIVNIDYIDEIIPWFNYTYKIKLKGNRDEELPVSRNYLKHFKEILGI